MLHIAPKSEQRGRPGGESTPRGLVRRVTMPGSEVPCPADRQGEEQCRLTEDDSASFVEDLAILTRGS